MTMRAALGTLWRQEDGQDLVEYTLLIAFVTLASAALFLVGTSGNVNTVWTTTNGYLTRANEAAS